jgi:hypothetical protein
MKDPIWQQLRLPASGPAAALVMQRRLTRILSIHSRERHELLTPAGVRITSDRCRVCASEVYPCPTRRVVLGEDEAGTGAQLPG